MRKKPNQLDFVFNISFLIPMGLGILNKGKQGDLIMACALVHPVHIVFFSKTLFLSCSTSYPELYIGIGGSWCGLMGGMLDFELNCPGLSPGWVNYVVLGRDTSNSQCLFTPSSVNRYR